MANINKVILIGRLGQDPELRYTQSGQPVCNLSMATSEVFIDKNGNKNEATEWHRVVVWGKPAESSAKYLSKGRAVYVEGKLTTRSWEDKDGKKCYTTEVVAHTVQFLDSSNSKPSNSKPSGNNTHLQQPQYAAPSPSLADIPF